ncbi:GNAT family N-acetyltransferase [Zeaxanthinibacter sp. PT1]|uniref:GNAT family N-acetyltransferase n=1 Tax=Zeaxanthinibacter TaxID=561554 RepID=UPI002349A075|nr:GNAT family N-acetyltransferase [Zeaxanthinibacter sp. PT1]MDC6350657.1 GNAT family N-acetyltransferase [Zeaxanthinibacter sp. PT1]
MNIKVKTFRELELQELYDLLALRCRVFVVEQDCPYQDPDGKDHKAWHVLGYKNDDLVAYTRVFKPGDYFEECSIGRVVVAREERKYGFGKDIMQASIDFVYEKFGPIDISLSAQKYLLKFYRDLGFRERGEEYLEDGIPHMSMVKKI